jgi:hypothetical protein
MSKSKQQTNNECCNDFITDHKSRMADERRTEISFECYVNAVTSPVHLYLTCVVQRVSCHRTEYNLQADTLYHSGDRQTDRQISSNVHLTIFIRQRHF